MSEKKLGLLYALSAFLFWGLTPMYYKQITMVPPFEILAHRVVFSVVVLVFLLFISKQFNTLKPIFKSLAKMKYLIFASILISINWFTFIYSISVNKIVEASLGYFITPLVTVALGFLIFQERVNKAQGIAIVLAIIAVVYQLATLGTIPIIALTLAFSFGFYGMVRKKIAISSIPGLFIETIVILPIALIYLNFLVQNEQSVFNTLSTYDMTVLSLSGLVTVLPLLWFNAAATRMSLTALGFIQYIGPTVAFLVAVFVYDEVLNLNKLITFTLIWVALVIFSLDGLKRRKA
ncbi:EamA family transporter RarD [Malaciobacter marinus]|uniref:Chloramphenicol-sensitive protein RarD n=1 Tax=Malaciobacter marinus TaxID=505249 RepID=A0AB36ZUZ7_9BACT|nr:EamA family transporter RarD [Malaciobacter marinus]PPK61118.1 chloramphenicol-sensitive protein RarD [Malaciobacter marinus]SKB36528.1 chloramphenicol-sensitive protein RarD [Malaciobacter marinus]